MEKKGRNTDLVALRNEKILARFVYWYDIQKVRMDETLRILSEEEFFLSQRHIWRIIKDRKYSSEYVAKLRKPSIRSVRGVPSAVKVVSEYSYDLFPHAKTQS